MFPSPESRVRRRRGPIALAAVALVAAVILPGAAAAGASTGSLAASGTVGAVMPLSHLGVTAGIGAPTAFAASSSAVTSAATSVEVRAAMPEISPKVAGAAGPGGAPGAGLGSPSPSPNPVAGSNPGFFGFNALSHYDQRTTNGGNQFSIEPPDQGLCVGNGFVVEALNDVVAVYHADGTLAAGPTAINLVFGYPAEFIRPAGPFGPELSDPRCLYDADTGRFFMTTLTFDTDRTTGALKGTTHIDIAVSQTNDPTGAWDRFSVNTTDDGKHGTPKHAGCPCFPDEPLLGADANGLYLSSNEFTMDTLSFVAGQVYALDKWALAAGTASKAVHFQPGALAEGIAYSVSPATAAGANSSANGGTEYFLSALQFGPSQFDDRIAIWAMTNTSSLATAHPALVLTHSIIHSEVYGQPDPSKQKNGPKGSRPLGESLHEKIELVDTGDDRMTQVTYQGGVLWSSLATALGTKGERTGIAWFKVTPGWHHGAVDGTVARQGYVSLAADNVSYPALVANDAGQVVISFCIVGQHYFPSTGYLTLVGSGAGSVHVAGAGVGPEDGFTGYVAYGYDGTARWGDYAGAAVDEAGNFWLGAEYIPGGTRTALANWGTFIGEVVP
jgi:hypothetical protein